MLARRRLCPRRAGNGVQTIEYGSKALAPENPGMKAILASVFVLAATGAEAQGLVPFRVSDGAIPASLTGKPGDPQKGAAVVTNRALGNCLACHKISALDKEPFQGEIGPPLDGVAGRWDEGQLRLIVVNAKEVFDGTVMPAFYRTEGLRRVRPQFEGKPILTAEQVEDVVAFLKTLKE